MEEVLLQKEKAFLCVASPDNKEELLDFYKVHSDPFLLPRPAGDFEKAIDHGNFFIIRVEGEIIAASGVFDYDEAEPFVELAETRVVKKWQGFGLQSLFFRLRVASVVLFQGREMGITTAIDNDNEASLANTKKIGFLPWVSIIPQAYNSCPTCPQKKAERKCCCDFYLLPSEGKKSAIQKILEESVDGKIIMKKKNEELVITCECKILVEYEKRSILKDFLKGP